jgi:hypothetical protein
MEKISEEVGKLIFPELEKLRCKNDVGGRVGVRMSVNASHVGCKIGTYG